MKKFFILIIIIFLLVTAFYGAFYAFLNLKGRKFIKQIVYDNFGTETELESLKFRFPFRLELKNFNCGDVSFSFARIALVGANPFRRKFIFDHLYIENFKLKIKRKDSKLIVEPFLKGISYEPSSPDIKDLVASLKKITKTSKESTGVERGERKRFSFSFVIKNAFLKNTTIEYIDSTLQPPLKANLKNVDLKIKNFNYPQMAKFYLSLSASLEIKKILMKNILSMKGWIDWKGKNMEAKLNIKNYDYLAFAQYYPPFWKPDNLEIKEAKLSLSSELSSINNNLVIQATLYLDKLVYKDNPQDPSKIEDLNRVIALFKKKGEGRPYFCFPTIKTKMDAPRIEVASLQEAFLEVVERNFVESMFGILKKTPKIINKGAEGIKKVTVDSAIEVIKEMLNGLKDVIGGQNQTQEE